MVQSKQGLKNFDRYKVRGAYHWEWYATNKFAYRDLVHLTLSYFPNKGTIFDVGCGDGLISYQLFRRGLHVTGIDPDGLAIDLGYEEIARAYRQSYPWIALLLRLRGQDIRDYLTQKGLTLRKQSIYDVPVTERYDYALCHEVIEHVPDPEGLIRKVATVTRRFAIFTTPNGNYHTPSEDDYQLWNPESFLRLFGSRRATMVESSQARLVVHLEME